MLSGDMLAPGRRPSIGIDLGSMFSRVAVFNPCDGRLAMVPDENGLLQVPSFVYLRAEESPVLGWEALWLAEVDQDGGLRPDPWQNPPIGLSCCDGTTDSSALILRHLKTNAERYLSTDEFERIVIAVQPRGAGHPGLDWTTSERVLQAARSAGFDLERVFLVPSPCAAVMGLATESSDRRPPFARVIVSDLGGRQYSCCAVEVVSAPSNGSEHFVPRIAVSGGQDGLGSELWTDVLEERVRWTCEVTHDRQRDEVSRWTVRQQVSRAKIWLSHRSKAMVHCCPRGTQSVTEAEFEECSQSLLAHLERALKGVLRMCPGYGNVLLVGGGSHMAQVRRLTDELTNGRVCMPQAPDCAAALGAAYTSAIFDPSVEWPWVNPYLMGGTIVS